MQPTQDHPFPLQPSTLFMEGPGPIANPCDLQRQCISCRLTLPYLSFSFVEFNRFDCPPTCRDCVTAIVKREEGFAANSLRRSVRLNDAVSAEFTYEALESPFAEGAFRVVSIGIYTAGRRKGQKCVAKFFKKKHLADRFLAEDFKSVDCSLHILREWNSRGFIDKHIQMSQAEPWTFSKGCGRWSGQKALLEPFIPNFEKWNSNTGWCDGTRPWSRIMQALSHFSFHISGGHLLLCDLQGGLMRNGVSLTDPVIMSRDMAYGVTDLGTKGISNFFSQHVCNEFCGRHWLLPRRTTRSLEPRKGTTIREAPRNESREAMSVCVE